MARAATTRQPATHLLAGKPLSGAETIIEVIGEQGVNTVFGYSGGAILPTYDAIFRYNEQHRKDGREIKLVVPANEQGAGFMAAGYARASGKVGVFLVTSGPGATNAVTPIRDCMADSIPVVMISGQVPTSAIGSDAFQEAPIFNIMSSCAKQVFLVTDPTKLEATVRAAFEIAASGRPGPVVVDVPKDIQNWVGPFQGDASLDLSRYRTQIHALSNNRVPVAKAQTLLRAIEKSRRPLIYAGGGVVLSGADKQLKQFAETLNIPVTMTLMGLGGIPTDHRLSLRMLGMHGTAYANYAVEDCDLLLALGARFDDRVAGKPSEFAPNAKFIAHIDIDEAEINKVKAVDWYHIGDLKTALKSILDVQAKHTIVKRNFADWHRHLAQLKRVHKMNYKRDGDLIQPQYVIEQLNKLTKGKAIVTTGVGQHQMWAAQYFDFAGPRLWLTSGSMGTMGFGLPAAIGAQFACPDKIVIDVDGDGSIRMNLGELETVTTYNLPVKILLLNNLGDGMVRQWQKLYFGHRFSGSDKQLHKKDFVKAAEADGFTFARRIDTAAEVTDALKAFIQHPGPALLDVRIDPDAGVYPMVGPGLPYSQMITGDYIAARTSPSTDTQDLSEKADLF